MSKKINKCEEMQFVYTIDEVNHKYIKLGDIVGNAFSDGLSLK